MAEYVGQPPIIPPSMTCAVCGRPAATFSLRIDPATGAATVITSCHGQEMTADLPADGRPLVDRLDDLRGQRVFEPQEVAPTDDDEPVTEGQSAMAVEAVGAVAFSDAPFKPAFVAAAAPGLDRTEAEAMVREAMGMPAIDAPSVAPEPIVDLNPRRRR